MIHRDIKKALKLIRMQVHRQDPIRTRGGDYVGHQLGRDRHASLILAILSGIPKVGDDSRNTLRTRSA